MRNQKTSLENKSKHASKMHSIHWEFLNDRFLRITYTYTKTQCFFFSRVKSNFTRDKNGNLCPWKINAREKTWKPSKRAREKKKLPVKIYLNLCPWNSKWCPWKKVRKYARETIKVPVKKQIPILYLLLYIVKPVFRCFFWHHVLAVQIYLSALWFNETSLHSAHIYYRQG